MRRTFRRVAVAGVIAAFGVGVVGAPAQAKHTPCGKNKPRHTNCGKHKGQHKHNKG
jgi:hypothetical protein